jgi:hypothetical protein
MVNKKLTKAEKNMMVVFIIISCLAIIATVLINIFAPRPVDPSTIPEPIPDDVKQSLAEMAPADERIQYIYDNMDQYSAQILTYFVTRIDTKSVIDFVYDYPQKHNLDEPIVFTEEELNSDLPLLLQYDERWGYKYLGGTENGEMLAESGCLCCCLNMIYIGSTHSDALNPYTIGCDMYENNLLGISGTKDKAVPFFCNKYGLSCEEYAIDETNRPDEKIIRDTLDSGGYILLSVKPGKFTKIGHAILIREYKDGKYYINDPASKIRSNTPYTFNEIAEDINKFWVISNKN